MAKALKYTNVEKKDRNTRLVAFIKGELDGEKHSFREAAKRFRLRSTGTVFRIFRRSCSL